MVPGVVDRTHPGAPFLHLDHRNRDYSTGIGDEHGAGDDVDEHGVDGIGVVVHGGVGDVPCVEEHDGVVHHHHRAIDHRVMHRQRHQSLLVVVVVGLMMLEVSMLMSMMALLSMLLLLLLLLPVVLLVVVWEVHTRSSP